MTRRSNVVIYCCPLTMQNIRMIGRNASITTFQSRRKIELNADDVVQFERFIDLCRPLRAVGGAATTALVERQFQLAQQGQHLFARGDVAKARTGAKRDFVEIVERRQATRKELAIDRAFGKTIDRTKAQSLSDSSFNPLASRA